MKFILALFLLLGASTASAYELSVTEIERPYEVVPVLTEDVAEVQVFLGELRNFPIMYEVVVSATTTLSAHLSQQYRSGAEPLPLSLIAVRQDDRGGGVTEIGRLSATDTSWQVVKESVLGMTFWHSGLLQSEIGPGTYRIEVSAPDNQGKYMLTLGAGLNTVVYGDATLSNIRATQKAFGLSIFKMLGSSRVYYPLGILLLVYGIYRTRKYIKSLDYGT